jgi:hypothetical protein
LNRAARLHERPHAQFQPHHFGRGAKHNRRADEDVFDPHGERIEGGRNGDVTQIDIKEPHKGGLVEARRILKAVRKYASAISPTLTWLGTLGQKIIVAYEDYNKPAKKPPRKTIPTRFRERRAKDYERSS